MITIEKNLSRRRLLKLAGAGTGAALLAACGAATPQAPVATTAPAAEATATEAPAAATEAPAAEATTVPAEATSAPAEATAATGSRALPDDAAPIEQQVLVLTGDPGRTYLDGSIQLYNTHVLNTLYSYPPIRFNHDFEASPGSAKTWVVDEKGTTWTFTLRDDIKWSDGKPLNAEDYVVTFQRYADPKIAYDFNWYFSETKVVNFDEATAGKAKPEDIGIRKGANDFELIFETKVPVPYLPQLLTYFGALHATKIKNADGSWNDGYNLDPATAVSAGPFILKENTPNRVVVEANPNLPDDLKPYLQKVIGIPLDINQRFQAYQAGQAEIVDVIETADIEAVQADETLKKELTLDVGDFRNDYFFFDVTAAPFDNVKVRQAFSHLLDRDSIVENITKPVASIPAPSLLAPGFPGYDPELASVQAYDVDKAKALFAESGVDPASVGKLTIEVRSNGGETRKAVAEVYAASIKENLGIDVDVQFVDSTVFMENLNAKPTKVKFGFVSYGFDYIDQSNFLSVFKTGGRHNWNNAEFQKLLDEASPLTDKAKRDQLFADAQRLLVTDAPAVFAVWRIVPRLIKEYIGGSSLQPGKKNTGYGFSWPGFNTGSLHPENLYITKAALERRPTPPA